MGTHSVYVVRGTYQGKRQVLYVGSTSRGLVRVLEHGRASEWWMLMSTMSWYHRKTRAAALKTERGLIQKFDPIFNKQK